VFFFPLFALSSHHLETPTAKSNEGNKGKVWAQNRRAEVEEEAELEVVRSRRAVMWRRR
jgi:hypothetical protein